MPPQLFPADPLFVTESEQSVWTLLRDTLRPEDTLIANYRLTDSTKDHEADLIVVMPEVGVVVIEVKGSGTGYRTGGGSDGSTASRPDGPGGPGAGHALRAPELRRVRPSVAGGLARQGQIRPCRRPAVHVAAGRLRRARLPALDGARPGQPGEPHGTHRRHSLGFETHRVAPTIDDCELIVEILSHKGSSPRPVWRTIPTSGSRGPTVSPRSRA
ncbi:hypothetical protein G7085_11905 [Tessaracoccus sp. HDW20]|nr:hypothetical protein [Tessaracoccus coleopterorum]